MKTVMVAILMALSPCVLNSRVQADGPPSVWDGIYTPAQAERGKAIYVKSCASCHGDMLEGSGQMPPLVGDEFLGDWDGQTVDDLFEKIQTTMPGDKPGTLTRAQNADVLSFVLAYNNFPKGSTKLPTEMAALQKIRFQAAKPK